MIRPKEKPAVMQSNEEQILALLVKVLRELRDIKNKIIYVEADVKRIKRQVNA